MALTDLPAGLRTDRALRLVWRASPSQTLLTVALTAFQGVLPLAWLYIVKLTVDRIGEASTADPATTFEGVAVLLAAAFGVAVLTAFCQVLADYVNSSLAHLVTDSIQQLVQQKSQSLDLEYYENPGAHEKLHRAQREAPGRPMQIVSELARLAQHFFTFAALLVLLVRFHWGIVVVILVAAVPLLAYRILYSQTLFDWRRSVSLDERQAKYLNDLLTTPASAKELRLFGFQDVVRQRFVAIRRRLRRGLLGLIAQRHKKEFMFSVLAAIAGYGTMAFVAYRAVYGAVSLGDLVMYFGAFQIALNSLRSLLNGLGSVYENNLFLSSLQEFLDVPKQVVEPPQPRPVPRPFTKGMRVENLTFRYPGTDRIVLTDIDIAIGKGETIALVGPNGSGKSTLIKLLCRLYDPTAGRITLDGVDLREFSTADLRNEISVIFQDYVHYQMSAKDNIWFGRSDAPLDEARVMEAARLAGIDDTLRNLKNGYDTVLGRWLGDGQELSIGQWQKLSLARSLYRDAQLVILDEPTASVDAGAEYEFFETFRKSIAGRSAVIVSHRFSTVQLADRIYVFDRGRITESGSHRELMSVGGLYAKLFDQQASPYR